MTVKKTLAVEDMTVDELLAITKMCSVCVGHSPDWDGHAVNPPCKGTARDEIIRRARLLSRRGPHDRVTLDAESVQELMTNPDSLDEIVISNCCVHLERMDTSWYYLGIYDSFSGPVNGFDGGLMLQVSIHAKSKKRVTATVYGSSSTEGIGGDAL